MLVQDRLSGYIHEVPDYGEPDMSGWPDPQTYGLGEVYDGLGNSLGLWFLPKLIKGAVGAVKGLVTGGARPALPAPAPMAPAMPAACPPCPPYAMSRPGFPPPGAPYPFPMTRRRRRRRR